MRPGSQRKLTPSTARTAPRFLSWNTLVRLRASIMFASSRTYACRAREITGARSALVAIGALLGVEPVGRHREHVVALDADAVNLLGRFFSRLGLDFVRFAHGLILTASGACASSILTGNPEGRRPGLSLRKHGPRLLRHASRRFATLA